jgi:hypothetical protein
MQGAQPVKNWPGCKRNPYYYDLTEMGITRVNTMASNDTAAQKVWCDFTYLQQVIQKNS